MNVKDKVLLQLFVWTFVSSLSLIYKMRLQYIQIVFFFSFRTEFIWPYRKEAALPTAKAPER